MPDGGKKPTAAAAAALQGDEQGEAGDKGLLFSSRPSFYLSDIFLTMCLCFRGEAQRRQPGADNSFAQVTG